MEASETQAPAQQQPAEGQAAAQPAPAQEAAPQAPAEQDPGIAEQIKAINERLDAALPQGEEQSLIGQLYDPAGEQYAEGVEGVDPATVQQAQQYDPYGTDPYGQQMDPQQYDAQAQEEFDARIQQGVAQALEPMMIEQRNADLNKLVEKYDLDEAQQEKVLGLVFQRFGEDPELAHIRTDPNVFEDFTKLVLADEAAADEKPAEEAANQGASLETGAGPSQQGEDDSAEQYKAKVFPSQSAEKDPFL
jgi:hypothetical protein